MRSIGTGRQRPELSLSARQLRPGKLEPADLAGLKCGPLGPHRLVSQPQQSLRPLGLLMTGPPVRHGRLDFAEHGGLRPCRNRRRRPAERHARSQ